MMRAQNQYARLALTPGAAENPWEVAYARFETPKQELDKFTRRLRKLGAAGWPRDAEIAELFCGRGNGLHALQRLGFTRLDGVDLSATLLAQYKGSARCHVCDCRHLPFENHSKQVLIVQGGLHHLLELPDDLDQTLSEMRRVLRKQGRLVLVEPWLTPFLSFVHGVCGHPIARCVSNKLDALATMIEHERPTYEQWLDNPEMILRLTSMYFWPVQQSFSWGKWCFVGSPR